MRIYILGIAGTFMGGVALIAKQLGFDVAGCDNNAYPPMSDVLESAGISIHQGFDPDAMFEFRPDIAVIGNALSRGNPVIEAVLNARIEYASGPEWLARFALQNKHVIAIAGTHGKTTTTAMLMWILEQAGLNPSFLVGGQALGFDSTARLTDSKHFVIEADEYDTAFFDKRSKFMHYHPNTLVLHNLEFDHADIFKDLEAIQFQFSNLLRTVPENGKVIYPLRDENITEVIETGCWSSRETLEGDWQTKNCNKDYSEFEVSFGNKYCGKVSWKYCGEHNKNNALAAIAAANDIGVKPEAAIKALNDFPGIKRRLEIKAVVNDVTIYDDFAHHPTAIATTVKGLRAKLGEDAKITGVIQFASNTMRMGCHKEALLKSFDGLDQIIMLHPVDPDWDFEEFLAKLPVANKSFSSAGEIARYLSETAKPNDHILIMSNKGFDGIYQMLEDELSHNVN